MMGKRKLIGFYMTILTMAASYMFSLVMGVTFSGDNVVVILTIYGALGGAFFGANFGEHWATSKKVPRAEG